MPFIAPKRCIQCGKPSVGDVCYHCRDRHTLVTVTCPQCNHTRKVSREYSRQLVIKQRVCRTCADKNLSRKMFGLPPVPAKIKTAPKKPQECVKKKPMMEKTAIKQHKCLRCDRPTAGWVCPACREMNKKEIYEGF